MNQTINVFLNVQIYGIQTNKKLKHVQMNKHVKELQSMELFKNIFIFYIKSVQQEFVLIINFNILKILLVVLLNILVKMQKIFIIIQINI